MNMLKKNDGFTLVELIVVIAIIAILSGVAVAGYSGYIKSANKSADTSALEAVNTAIASALAMEGENTADADEYITVTCTDAKVTITPKDMDEKETGVQNDVWDNFVAFYNLSPDAPNTSIELKGYKYLDGKYESTGVLAGSDEDPATETSATTEGD